MQGIQNLMQDAFMMRGDHQGYMRWEDGKEAAKHALYTGVAAAGVWAVLQYIKRTNNPAVDFKDPVDVLPAYPDLAEAFYNLQAYRDVHPQYFQLSISFADRLLFTEKSLREKAIAPDRVAHNMATTMFKGARYRLSMLMEEVRKRMGREHFRTAMHYRDMIFKQLENHYMNILIILNQPINPEDMLRRVKQDLETKKPYDRAWKDLQRRVQAKLEARPSNVVDQHLEHQSRRGF